MTKTNSTETDQVSFEQLANSFHTKLSPKFALLWPHRNHIEGLLAKRASYNDIRLLLHDAKIVVSKNTLYRFCHRVLGKTSVRQSNASIKSATPTTPIIVQTSIAKPPGENVGVPLRDPNERYDGPWSKKKNGPRIANPKNF